jgi:hypothetical protein
MIMVQTAVPCGQSGQNGRETGAEAEGVAQPCSRIRTSGHFGAAAGYITLEELTPGDR